MEKKQGENGVQYGLDKVAQAAHTRMLDSLDNGDVVRARVWHDIAEEVRSAIVGQLFDAIEHGEADRAALISTALRGWGVL